MHYNNFKYIIWEIVGNSQKKNFVFKVQLMFQKIKKNSHVTNYITEKCHTKYNTFVNIYKIFCNTSSFTHYFLKC